MATRVREPEQVAPPPVRPAVGLDTTGVIDDSELEALAARRLRVALGPHRRDARRLLRLHPVDRVRQGLHGEGDHRRAHGRNGFRRARHPCDLGAHLGVRSVVEPRVRAGAGPAEEVGHAAREIRSGRAQLGRDRLLPRVRGDRTRDLLVGGPPDPHDRAVLRGRPQRDRFPERARARGRLHERRELPRDRRAGRTHRLRRPHLLDRLPRRLADRALPDRRAAAQPRAVHVRRRGCVPAEAGARAARGGGRHAVRGDLLPDRPDGRRRDADQPDLRPRLRALGRDRRRGHADPAPARRHDRDHLGADRQGRPADRRRDGDGIPRARRVRAEPARPLLDGRGRERRGGACAGLARVRPLGRDLARPRADVRDGRAAAHPDALLHRAEREGGAHVRELGDALHRVLLPADVRARLRRDGARRARPDQRHRRGRQRGRAAPGGERGGHPVLRLHRGGGVRDHPRRRRRPDALGRGGPLARRVGERRPAR